jgi:hypothetical protein
LSCVSIASRTRLVKTSFNDSGAQEKKMESEDEKLKRHFLVEARVTKTWLRRYLNLV